ncbi:hypothetical protein [Haloechinothrix salitolerans]|uniref:Uncharacterized protein n=1 Tax=Haloechinothrix salitolerans TaxID=926830 RepID=A0ABW2C1A1_9PSEU
MLVLGPATPAQADPIPPTDYPPVAISDIPRARHIVTDVYGNVTVGCPIGTATNAAKTFDPSGSVVQTIATGSTWREFCDWDSVVGVDGTVFLYAEPNSYTHQVQAWRNGSMVWEYTIPCGSNTSLVATAIGTDGNFYFVAKARSRKM